MSQLGHFEWNCHLSRLQYLPKDPLRLGKAAFSQRVRQSKKKKKKKDALRAHLGMFACCLNCADWRQLKVKHKKHKRGNTTIVAMPGRRSSLRGSVAMTLMIYSHSQSSEVNTGERPQGT